MGIVLLIGETSRDNMLKTCLPIPFKLSEFSLPTIDENCSMPWLA